MVALQQGASRLSQHKRAGAAASGLPYPGPTGLACRVFTESTKPSPGDSKRAEGSAASHWQQQQQIGRVRGRSPSATQWPRSGSWHRQRGAYRSSRPVPRRCCCPASQSTPIPQTSDQPVDFTVVRAIELHPSFLAYTIHKRRAADVEAANRGFHKPFQLIAGLLRDGTLQRSLVTAAHDRVKTDAGACFAKLV